jgi:hypothetical protein
VKNVNEVKAIKRENRILPGDSGFSQLGTMVRWFARPGDLPWKKKKADLVEGYNLTKEKDEFDRTSLRTNETAIPEEILLMVRANEGNLDAPDLQGMDPKTLK